MTTLTGKTPANTYKDLLQVSNNNSGIDGTRRNISDGEGTNAPVTLSTSAAAFTGIADFTGGSPLFSNNSIPLAAVDLSDDDTISGNIDVASGSTIDFLSGSTLNLATGSSFTSYNDAIPLASVDLSGNDTFSGAISFTSTATFTTGSTLDISSGTFTAANDQIPLAKIDLSDNDTLTGTLSVGNGGATSYTTGSSLSMTSGATLSINENVTRGSFVRLGELLDTSTGSSFNTTDLASVSTPRRLSVVFESVSLSGTDNLLVQLGDSGGIETTGYNSVSAPAGLGTGGVVTSTAGFIIQVAGAARVTHGILTIINVTGNVWVASFCGGRTDSSAGGVVATGTKTLSGALTQLTVTRTGTDTFDGGQVRVLIE